MAEMQELNTAIEKGKRDDAKRLTQELLDAGVSPSDIVDNGLVPGMMAIGVKFKANEVFVPEVLIAARAMKEAMGIVEPLLAEAGIVPKYRVVIGTVQGDLHDIGKNLVAMMLKGANFGVIDLGTNVPAEKFIAAVEEHKPQLVGLSALLTTTMPAMKATVEAIKASGGDTKVIVGGAPITRAYADEIGADGFAGDAASAVDEALALVAA